MENPTKLNSLVKDNKYFTDDDSDEIEDDNSKEESLEDSDDNSIVELEFDTFNIEEDSNFINPQSETLINMENREDEKSNQLPNKTIIISDKESKDSNAEEARQYSNLFQNKMTKNFEKIFLNNNVGGSNNVSNASYNNLNISNQKNDKIGIVITNNSKISNIKTIKKTELSLANPSKQQSKSSKKKSVFTKVAEQAFNKMLKTKGKISSYDELTCDQYLKKILERSDTESTFKMNSFLERTKDYNAKKNMQQYQQMQEKEKKNRSSTNNFLKNSTSQISAKEVRSPEKYLQDQMKHVQDKESNLNMIRENKKRELEKNIKSRPQISKKSMSLAKKKKDGDAYNNCNINEKDIHTRLYEDGLQKKKGDLLKSANSKEKKLTDKEMSELVEKLYNDAFARKNRVNSYEKEGIFIYDNIEKSTSRANSVNSTNGFNSIKRSRSPVSIIDVDDYDLTTNSSKLVAIRKFIKEFDMSVLNLYSPNTVGNNTNQNSQNNSAIKFYENSNMPSSNNTITFKNKISSFNFEEYCQLKLLLGYIKYDHFQKYHNVNKNTISSINCKNPSPIINDIPEGEGVAQTIENNTSGYNVIYTDNYIRSNKFTFSNFNKQESHCPTQSNLNSATQTQNSQLNLKIEVNNNIGNKRNSISNLKNNFTSNNATNNSINIINDDLKNLERKMENEMNLIKDSWRILTKKKNLDGGEKVEIYEILLYMLSIQGLYKGSLESLEEEGEDREEEREIEEKKDNDNKFNESLNKKSLSDKKNKMQIESTINNRNKEDNSSKGNGPMKFSPINSLISFYNVSGTNFNKSTLYKTPSIEMKDNLIAIALPEFDTKKYFYPTKIVKQIKMLFRKFYDNRKLFLISKKEEKFKLKLSNYINDPECTFKPKITDNSIRSASEYRSRWIEKYSDANSKEEWNPSPESRILNKKNKKLKIEDVYEIQRKKKEK